MNDFLNLATPCPHKFRDPKDRRIRTCRGISTLTFSPVGMQALSKMNVLLHCTRCGHMENYQVDLGKYVFIPKTLLTAITTENLTVAGMGESKYGPEN